MIRDELAVQLRRRGPWRSCSTGHRITRDSEGGQPWQTRTRPWTIPAELFGRWLATRESTREAVARALDRKTVVETALASMATPAAMWPLRLPGEWPEHDDELPGEENDR